MLKYSRTVLLFSFLFCFKGLFAEEGYIAADALNIRAQPSVHSSVIGGLHFGEIVTILRRSPNLETIQGIGTNLWFLVSIENRQGWIFGFYLARERCKSSDNSFKVWVQETDFSGVWTTYRITTFIQDRRGPVYDLAGSALSFSPSCNYVAVDSGSDVIRGLAFHDLLSGKLLAQDNNLENIPEWTGNCARFHSVFYTADRCTLWKEKEFCDGIVNETGITGNGSFHWGPDPKRDPRCPPLPAQ